MEVCKCNICQSSNMENLFKKDSWDIVRCSGCGLVFVKNIPCDTNLKNIYDAEFFKDGQKSPIEGLRFDDSPAYINASKRLEKIRKMGFSNGRMLDIGCSTGIFLKAASSHYDGVGLDISKYATEFATNNLGVKAKCGTIFDLNFEQKNFDIITMWDVIEHVRDPDKYIDKVSQFIRPGGLLALSTGNIQSLMFKVQKKKWHLLIPPQHLFYFSPNTISILLENHGFKIIKISYDGQYTNIGYIIDKLKRIHTKNKLIKFMDFFIKTIKLNKLNIYLNLYDVITVYAQRDSEDW